MWAISTLAILRKPLFMVAIGLALSWFSVNGCHGSANRRQDHGGRRFLVPVAVVIVSTVVPAPRIGQNDANIARLGGFSILCPERAI